MPIQGRHRPNLPMDIAFCGSLSSFCPLNCDSEKNTIKANNQDDLVSVAVYEPRLKHSGKTAVRGIVGLGIFQVNPGCQCGGIWD